MKKILFLLLFFIKMVPDLKGQGYWERALGPYGNVTGDQFRLTKTVDGKVYGITSLGEVIRSEDEGLTWTNLPFLPPIDSSAYDELSFTIGYSGAFYKVLQYNYGNYSPRKVFKSTDEGSNWILLNADAPVFSTIETNDGNLLGISHYNMLRSVDQGVSWQVVTGVNANYGWAADIQLGTDGVPFAYGGLGELRYSLDNGLTWEAVSLYTIPDFSPWRMPGGTIFFTASNHLYRTSDDGASWTEVGNSNNINLGVNSMLALPSGRLLLTTNRLYFSDDDGLTWSEMNVGVDRPYELLPVGLAGDAVLGLGKGGIYRSSDGGLNWNFSSWGIRSARVNQMVFFPDSVRLATTPYGLWKTTDSGLSWEVLLKDTSDAYNYSQSYLDCLNADSFIFCMGNRMLRTLDGGQTFTDITPGNLFYGNYTIELFIDPVEAVLYCTTEEGICRSYDWGISWQVVLPGLGMVQLVAHPEGDLFLVAHEIPFAGQPPLMRSSDHGQTWEQVDIPGIESPYGFGVGIYPDGKLYVQGRNAQNVRLAISNDKGDTWDYTIIPERGGLLMNELGHLFIFTSDRRFLCSVDNGQSWFYLPWILENGEKFAPSGAILIDPDGYLYVNGYYSGLHRSSKSTLYGAYLTGQIDRDADADCTTADAQTPMSDWVVKADGPSDYFATTNADGRYTIFTDTGQYQVSVQVPQAVWWAACDSPRPVSLETELTTDTVDFSIIALADCPLMSVNVGAPLLRRCFENPVFVQYCNRGSQPSDSAWVDVVLDPFLTMTGSTQPYDSLGEQTFRFYIGDVQPGQCGQFSCQVLVNCDATVIGQTHCISAHVFPDTLCTPVPGWSGADLVAGVECQDSVLQFRLQNVGSAASQALDYIVIEDDVVLLQGTETYDPTESLLLNFPANGHTWRIESTQEPGHPFSVRSIAFEEGCGGFGSLGQINKFGVDDREPAYDRVCVENTGSYDPNDKQGFPHGMGDNHFIRPGQDLEYLIRFQNTGTDTAFRVVVRDTLTGWLDAASVQPGVASHPYTWTLGGTGVLTFVFDDILLPDSNVNLAGSQGFVSFKIRQLPQLADGTEILNSAAIYFDYNDAVITNQTRHTIGTYSSLPVFEKPDVKSSAAILIQPQPVGDVAVLRRADGGEFRECRFLMSDALGRQVREARLNGAAYHFERDKLPAGVYHFRIEKGDGVLLGAGTLLLR